MRAEGGPVSTITVHCASQPRDSGSPRKRRFPPQPQKPPGWSKRLSFPPVTDLAGSSADKVLVFQPARRHHDRAARLARQAALADRARLSRAQAGAGPRPLRGARLARLPSPRRAVRRRIRLPVGRAGRDSPLGTRIRLAGQNACPSRRSPTPRHRRSSQSVTSRIRSRPCADASPTPSHRPSTGHSQCCR